MFYYPPNSCCFVLWGSFSEEVWPAEQRHKAQVLVGSRLLAPPSLAPTPSQPQAGRSGSGRHRGAQPREVHLLLYDFYPPRYCWGCQQVALGGGHAQWVPARGCILRHPENRLPGQTVHEQLRRAGQGSGGLGWFPAPSPAGKRGHSAGSQAPWEVALLGRQGCRMQMPARRARGQGCCSPQHRMEPVPHPESQLWGWGSPSMAREWGPHGKSEHQQGQVTVGTWQPLSLVLPFLLLHHLCPFAYAGGNRGGTAWGPPGTCQHWGCRSCAAPRLA